MLLRRTLRLGLDAAVQITLGIPLARLSADWIESVRATYLPEAARAAEPDEHAVRLTGHRFAPGSRAFASYVAPALSPDGRRIVYLSDRGNDLYSFYDLWLASAETGEVIGRLVRAARSPDFESLRFLYSSAAWSPDGRYIAFAAQAGARDVLYVYDVERRRVARKIRVPLDAILNPTFSPDGTRIAFTGLHGGVSDLYVTDLTDGQLRQLTDDRYADLHPAWSPDGRSIAIATDRGPATDFDRLVFGNLRIALYHLGRGDVELLPDQDRGTNVNPVWSPDGDAIAFVSDRTGTANVYLWSLAERRLYQVTDLLAAVSGVTPLSPAISWAARADRLAYTCLEGAGYNIYVIDRPRALARPVSRDGAPPRVAAGRGSPAAGGDAAADDDGRPAAERREGGVGQSFYRVLDGFRPSAARPGSAEPAAPARELTIRALLDDARSGLPDTASFEDRDYHASLSPDVVGQPVIGAQVGGFYGSGVYGGSYILLSDVLGDHNLLLWGQVAGSLDDAYIVTRYSYLRERANLSMAYQQFPLYRFWGTRVTVDETGAETVEDRFQRDVYRTLSTELRYPFNRFQRLELSAAGFYVSRDSVIGRLALNATGVGERRARRLENLMFAGPAVALVWDDALFGYTGPMAGRRYRLEIGRYFGDVTVNLLTVDLRNYFHLGGRYTLATRLTAYSRSGRDEREFRVYWGGPYFIRGYDGGSFSAAECAESARRVIGGSPSACPVRDQLTGSSVALASAELRFPIVTFLDFGVVPLGLPPIDGVIFFDVGAAFNSFGQLAWERRPGQDPYAVRDPVAAVGAGIRVNILYNVFRLDYAYPLDRPGRHSGVWSLSFGPTF